MFLYTPRLILRRAVPDDLEAIHAVMSNARATRWWSTPPHADLKQTSAWLNGMIASPPELSEDFVVEKNGRVIGKAGLYRLPDVGYILHPDHWGQGLGKEAVGAVIDHVFQTRALDALTADVDPENVASIRLLEGRGFVRTGFAEKTWEIAGEWKDSVYYGLSRSHWAERRDRHAKT
ncbi:GNAT family N-acetyltransferase [Brevundimonas sp.]|uniref:GNAT family N-acetyltransferase n=1 Tax=Brevundimonas sp. TaxID=1871086 RepID=UPI003567B812